MTALVLVGIALVAMPCTSNGQAAVPVATNWAQVTPAASPTARSGAAMAYDAANGTVVLFGGADSNGNYLNDTWVWNGSTWTVQTTHTAPSARFLPSMAYDGYTGTLVLFGGSNNTGALLADTWIWNGTAWSQASPATHPGARSAATMAYDAATSSLLLFSGYTAYTNAETWSWNGTTWTQLSPATSPPSRQYAAMAYNPTNGTVVLFGGSPLSGSNSNLLNDTWTWNGTTWTQQSPAVSPTARQNSTMSYDPALGGIVLFGGNIPGSFVADTWLWTGSSWTQLAPPTSPSPRSGPISAYDMATGSLLLFGGTNTSSTILNDTWNYGSTPNFGTVAVGSSSTSSATFNVTTAGTMGTPLVLTQGAPNLDFTLGTGSTCTGSVAVGTCTVNVVFTPAYPGQRLGAVELTNSSGTVIATALVNGLGTGPQASLSPGVISTVAGNAQGGYVAGQDGGPATSAGLYYPESVAVDAAGNLYIADTFNQRIRKVTASTGIITTIAGTGTAGYSPTDDGGPATSALINVPVGIVVDGAGNVYFSDYANQRIRKITAATGIITTAAGTGTGGYLASQDGGPATNAEVNNPLQLAVDGSGNVYIADSSNNRVRKLTAATGTISTVAGNGTRGYLTSEENGVATSAELGNPQGVAVDAAGNIYIGNTSSSRVQKVAADTGLITTVAGNGTGNFSSSQNGGPATSAGIYSPGSVAVNAAGDFYIADTATNRLFKVYGATGYIFSIAADGSGSYAASQDGGPSTNAQLAVPHGLALDGAGNLYLGDTDDNRIRKVSTKAGISFATATAAGTSDTTDGTQTATLNNIGNVPLTIASMANATTGSFTLANPMTGGCSTAVTVSVGGSCLLGEQFAPAAGSSGGVSNSLIVTDNSLNVSGTVQSVPLLGTTMAGAVTVSVSAPSVVAGTASDPITVIVGYSGTAADTGAVTLTVNGSATGVGTPTCSAKGGHMNCAYPYTGTALRSSGNYTIAVAVAADGNYSAGSATGTLAVTGAPTVVKPIKPVVVAKPTVSSLELK